MVFLQKLMFLTQSVGLIRHSFLPRFTLLANIPYVNCIITACEHSESNSFKAVINKLAQYIYSCKTLVKSGSGTN